MQFSLPGNIFYTILDQMLEPSTGILLIAEPFLKDTNFMLEGIKIPVYFGGPVQADTLHFLHVCPDQIPGSQAVTDGIYWGGDFGMVKDLLRKNKLDHRNIRFYVGYSGWGNNQLNEELKGESWITTMAKQDLVFNYDIEDIWKESLKLLGGDYSLMTNFPVDPQLN